MIISHRARFSAVICDVNHPRKSRKAQKMAIFTKKSKIFIKAKLTASKSCLLGPTCSMIFSIFRGAHLQKVKYLKSPSYDFWNFSYAQLHWHSSNSFCWVCKRSPTFLFKIQIERSALLHRQHTLSSRAHCILFGFWIKKLDYVCKLNKNYY